MKMPRTSFLHFPERQVFALSVMRSVSSPSKTSPTRNQIEEGFCPTHSLFLVLKALRSSERPKVSPGMTPEEILDRDLCYVLSLEMTIAHAHALVARECLAAYDVQLRTEYEPSDKLDDCQNAGLHLNRSCTQPDGKKPRVNCQAPWTVVSLRRFSFL